MKKIFALLCVVFICTGFIFADDTGDEYDDYDDSDVYEINGAGDQFLKIGLMPVIPLNFDKKIHVGGGAEFGYYRFVNKWLAIGGEASFSFNTTIGSNILTLLPIVFGATFQPSVGKFEFPVLVAVGIAHESAQNSSYFPGFAFKSDVGAYYRIGEAWSFGLSCQFLWLPQWYKDSSKNDNGLFLAPTVSARYHF